jgi:large subunit ribosomal protein L23
MDLNQVVIQPLMTEKVTKQREQNKYAFLVHKKANKTLIKDALEKIYNVHIEHVRVANIKPKARRVRFMYQTHIPGYKKAIVKLFPDSRPFEFYEGV